MLIPPENLVRLRPRPPQLLTGDPLLDDMLADDEEAARLAPMLQAGPTLRLPRRESAPHVERIAQLREAPRSTAAEKILAGLGVGAAVAGALAGSPGLAGAGGVLAKSAALPGQIRQGRRSEEISALEEALEDIETQNRRADELEARATFDVEREIERRRFDLERRRLEAREKRRQGQADEAAKLERQVEAEARRLENAVEQARRIRELPPSEAEAARLALSGAHLGLARQREARLAAGGPEAEDERFKLETKLENTRIRLQRLTERMIGDAGGPAVLGRRMAQGQAFEDVVGRANAMQAEQHSREIERLRRQIEALGVVPPEGAGAGRKRVRGEDAVRRVGGGGRRLLSLDEAAYRLGSQPAPGVFAAELENARALSDSEIKTAQHNLSVQTTSNRRHVSALDPYYRGYWVAIEIEAARRARARGEGVPAFHFTVDKEVKSREEALRQPPGTWVRLPSGEVFQVGGGTEPERDPGQMSDEELEAEIRRLEGGR